MKKALKMILGLFVGAFMVVPFMGVNAAEPVEVDNAEDLYTYLEGSEVAEVKLTKDIETTHKINVTSDKIIDGNGHKITYVGTFKGGSHDNTEWGSDAAYPYNGGVYVIQAYNANVTVKNITLTGGNVGLSANGANLTLEGKIDVSGNGFGGIELTKGAAPTLSVPSLTINNATIVNTTEEKDLPTLWTDNLSTEEVESMNIEYNGVKVAVTCDKEDGKPLQVQLFLDENNLPTGDNYVELDAADFRPEEVNEPTTPEEPAEEVKDEEKVENEVKDEVENPKTSDGIMLVSMALAVSTGLVIVARKKLA